MGKEEEMEGEGAMKSIITSLCSSIALQVEKEKPPINVVGDVHAKIAIMIVSAPLCHCAFRRSCDYHVI